MTGRAIMTLGSVLSFGLPVPCRRGDSDEGAGSAEALEFQLSRVRWDRGPDPRRRRRRGSDRAGGGAAAKTRNSGPFVGEGDNGSGETLRGREEEEEDAVVVVVPGIGPEAVVPGAGGDNTAVGEGGRASGEGTEKNGSEAKKVPGGDDGVDGGGGGRNRDRCDVAASGSAAPVTARRPEATRPPPRTPIRENISAAALRGSGDGEGGSTAGVDCDARGRDRPIGASESYADWGRESYSGGGRAIAKGGAAFVSTSKMISGGNKKRTSEADAIRREIFEARAVPAAEAKAESGQETEMAKAKAEKEVEMEEAIVEVEENGAVEAEVKARAEDKAIVRAKAKPKAKAGALAKSELVHPRADVEAAEEDEARAMAAALKGEKYEVGAEAKTEAKATPRSEEKGDECVLETKAARSDEAEKEVSHCGTSLGVDIVDLCSEDEKTADSDNGEGSSLTPAAMQVNRVRLTDATIDLADPRPLSSPRGCRAVVSLYLVPLGRAMSASRVRILRLAIDKKKGRAGGCAKTNEDAEIIVLNSFGSDGSGLYPTHVVLDGSLNAKRAAEALGVIGGPSEMASLFSKVGHPIFVNLSSCLVVISIFVSSLLH